MPSGKTHDSITVLLTLPILAFGLRFCDFREAAIITTGFMIGGFIFGPDLDTRSIQYRRWSILRFIWLPYRTILPHRSRFTHGLIFGTFIRVVYFIGAITICAYIVTISFNLFMGSEQNFGIASFSNAWIDLARFSHLYFGRYFLVFVFVGLWVGAASHILTDRAISYLKTGKFR